MVRQADAVLLACLAQAVERRAFLAQCIGLEFAVFTAGRGVERDLDRESRAAHYDSLGA